MRSWWCVAIIAPPVSHPRLCHIIPEKQYFRENQPEVHPRIFASPMSVKRSVATFEALVAVNMRSLSFSPLYAYEPSPARRRGEDTTVSSTISRPSDSILSDWSRRVPNVSPPVPSPVTRKFPTDRSPSRSTVRSSFPTVNATLEPVPPASVFEASK